MEPGLKQSENMLLRLLLSLLFIVCLTFFSEKRIDELLRELQKDPEFQAELLRRNQSKATKPRRRFEERELALVHEHEHLERLAEHRLRRQKSTSTKKPRTLRYDYKVPEDDLSDSQVRELLHVYDMSQPVKEEYECVSLSIRPNVPVCLYPDKVDIHVSAAIRKRGIWEPHIIKVSLASSINFFGSTRVSRSS